MRRIRRVDPDARELGGAAEAYDATVLLALAAETARSDAPGPIAGALVAVSRQGEACNSFEKCRDLAEELTDIDYDGLSGAVQFLDNGDPGESPFAIVEFDKRGMLDVKDRTTAQASPLVSPPPPPDPTFGRPADGVLRLGTLLPIEGPLPTTARAALAGIRLAVEEINVAGGVLGSPIELLADESGDGSSLSTKTAVPRLIDRQVDAVIGGTTFEIDSVAFAPLTDAGVILFSPTDSFRGLSVVADRGLFFRLAPPDDLEGKVLGTLVVNDGFTSVAIVAPSSGPEFDLASDVTAAINAAGGTVTVSAVLDPTSDVAAASKQVLDSGSQAVVIIAPTPAAGSFLREQVRRGIGPGTLPTFGTVGSMNAELARLLGDG